MEIIKRIGDYQYVTAFDPVAAIVWLFQIKVSTGEIVSQCAFCGEYDESLVE